MTTRARSYVFTWNNPNEFDYSLISCKYMIVGAEVAPETKTPHHQGYIMFPSQKVFTKVKTILPPGCHIEAANGTPQQNIKYCSKESIHFEKGDRPEMGKRNDIVKVKEAVAEGKGMSYIIDLTNSYQAMRCGELILKYKERKRDFKPIIKWYYGPTGTGKSRAAYAETKDPWVSGKNLQWWQGYDAHAHVILDDFRASHCEYDELLRILDRYPFTVDCKGGSRQLLATLTIITSHKSPQDLFSNSRENVDQLLRRIDELKEFTL